ncbi:MAG: hypothetical protein HQ483_01545 [Rhodospirillales bacterium]|nr:hypothetical protein [Rhodospirillales bacterium]
MKISELPRGGFWLLLLVLSVATGLRLWSMTGDLWIDEVWSLNHIALARASENSQDWLALFFHANTHALNTLYLAALGPDASNAAYRSLSFVSGVAMVLLAACIGLRRNLATGVIAALLFGLSYPLINYSGEARGYAPMLLAALACYALLARCLASPAFLTGAGFVAVSLLGLLAHLSFGVVMAGLGLWALISIYEARRAVVPTLARLVPLFGLQLVYLSAYGSIALTNMVRGGDCCPEPALASIRIMTYWTIGLDANRITSLVPLLTLLLAAFILVYMKYRAHHKEWILFAVVLFVFPIVVLLLEQQPDVIHRYFLPVSLFGLLVFSQGLGQAWTAGGWSRGLAALLLAGFMVGQAGLLLKFSDGGRGQYGQVLATIAAAGAGPQRVTGFPTFSVGSVFAYQARYDHLNNRLIFVSTRDEGDVPADWFINGYLYGKPAAPMITRTQESGRTVSYALINSFPQWGLSGDTWALYRLSP